MTSGSEDASLLAAHVAGDPDAFAELVRRHRDRLWAVALRTIGDREEAADAVQEALLSAFRRAESFRGDAQVSTWLHRIVVNACLDRLRRQRSHPSDPLPEDEDRLGAIADKGRPEDPVEASERRTDVMAALGELSEDQRTAIVLVDMEGYSIDDVAEIMECAPGTVKSRCARGRARLVPLLEQYRRERPVMDDGEDERNRDRARDVQLTDLSPLPGGKDRSRPPPTDLPTDDPGRPP